MVGHVCVQHRGVQTKVSHAPEGRKRRLAVNTVDVTKEFHVAHKVAPAKVGRRRNRHVTPYPRSGHGRVGVLLVVAGVGVYAYILVIIRPVVQAVVGIFGDGPDAKGPETLPVRELCKEVLVPLAPYIGVLVRQSSHHATR